MHPHRILRYNLDDIVVDARAVALSITERCRSGPQLLKVAGVCQANHEVIFTLEPQDDPTPRNYVLAPYTSQSMEDVIADVSTRWASGFTTKGLIRLSESWIGVFEAPEPFGVMSASV